MSNVSSSRSDAGFGWQPAFAAFNGPTTLAWSLGHDESSTETLSLPHGPGLVAASWREDPTRDRVFVNLPNEEPTPYDLNSAHVVLTAWSDESFVNQSAGLLEYCNDQSQCAASPEDPQSSFVRSSQSLAVAWEPNDAVSLTAWVNSNRTDDAEDGEIWISAGHFNDTLLSEPTRTGVRSAVAPALACTSGSTLPGGYRCLLVYVNQADKNCETRVKRAALVSEGGLLTVQLEAGAPHISQSCSRPALWYHAGQFWLMVRHASPGQPLALRSTTDGVNWGTVGYYGASVIGPSAVSWWTGTSNTVMYAK